MNFNRFCILESADERGANRHGLDSIFVTAMKIRTPFSSRNQSPNMLLHSITGLHHGTSQLSISHLGLLTIHTLGMCIVNTPRCSVNNLYIHSYCTHMHTCTCGVCSLQNVRMHPKLTSKLNRHTWSSEHNLNFRNVLEDMYEKGSRDLLMIGSITALNDSLIKLSINYCYVEVL